MKITGLSRDSLGIVKDFLDPRSYFCAIRSCKVFHPVQRERRLRNLKLLYGSMIEKSIKLVPGIMYFDDRGGRSTYYHESLRLTMPVADVLRCWRLIHSADTKWFALTRAWFYTYLKRLWDSRNELKHYPIKGSKLLCN